MPRGYPDYFGQSIFPKYGKIYETGATVPVASGLTKSIALYSGKGIMYNIDIYVDADTVHSDDVITIKIDGNGVAAPSWYFLKFYGYTRSFLAELCLLMYDQENFIYHAIVPGPVSFISSAEVTYKNNHADGVDVNAFIVHSKIE